MSRKSGETWAPGPMLSLRKSRPAWLSAVSPQLLPFPEAGHNFHRQRESVLMRQHAHLAAMVGFVSEHVAQHFRTDRPGLSPAIAVKSFDAVPTTEGFDEHLGATGCALGQSGAGLLRRAVGAVELGRNLQVRSGQPDPLRADIVHVSEDRGNSAGRDVAGLA